MSTQIPTPRTKESSGNIRTTIGGNIEFLPCEGGEFVRADDMVIIETELHIALTERDEARRDTERLARSFRRFANHDSDCKGSSGRICTCGLDENTVLAEHLTLIAKQPTTPV